MQKSFRVTEKILGNKSQSASLLSTRLLPHNFYRGLSLSIFLTPLRNPHTRGFLVHIKPPLFLINKRGNKSQIASLLCDPVCRVTYPKLVTKLPLLFFRSLPLFRLFGSILQILCRLGCFRLLFLLLLG